MNRNTKRLRAAELRLAVRAAKQFKALGDESRVKIVLMLASGETNACDMVDQLGISQPTLSHHLRILSEAQLVACEKEGKWRVYSLSEQGKQAAQFIKGE